MPRLKREEQIELLRNLATTMVKSVAEKPEEVVVRMVDTQHNLVFEICVASSDMGLVLGRDGCTAESMRDVMYVACKKTDFKITLDIVTKDKRGG